MFQNLSWCSYMFMFLCFFVVDAAFESDDAEHTMHFLVPMEDMIWFIWIIVMFLFSSSSRGVLLVDGRISVAKTSFVAKNSVFYFRISHRLSESLHKRLSFANASSQTLMWLDSPDSATSLIVLSSLMLWCSVNSLCFLASYLPLMDWLVLPVSILTCGCSETSLGNEELTNEEDGSGRRRGSFWSILSC